MSTDNVEIVQIPLGSIEKTAYTQRFHRMPILYLELTENKSKVKPEFLGKDYVPEDPEPEDEPEQEIQQTPSTEELEDTDEQEPKDSDNESEDDENEHEPEIETEPEIEKPKVPTLTELQAKHPKKLIKPNDFKYPQKDDEDDSKRRNEVFFHYEVLKRMHPRANIPEFTAYSDPKVMAQKYELLAKSLALDSSVENWKCYMIIFMMGCEVVLGQLNFDMEGFAQQQISTMNTYDQLLVEMAEKSYTPKGSKWSVEVRLMMTMTMNIALFIVSKMITKSTGTNLLGAINKFLDPNKTKTFDFEDAKLRDP